MGFVVVSNAYSGATGGDLGAKTEVFENVVDGIEGLVKEGRDLGGWKVRAHGAGEAIGFLGWGRTESAGNGREGEFEFDAEG